MLKRPILLAALAGAVAAGLWFLYRSRVQTPADPWEMVPGNAVFVYESRNAVVNWNDFITRAPGKSLLEVPLLRDFESGLLMLDSITGKSGTIDRLFRGNTLLASAHITSASGFDMLYFLDLGAENSPSALEALHEALEKHSGYTLGSRQYQGVEIHEIRNRQSGKIFSFVRHAQVVAASFTPLLVEDVIRRMHERGEAGFARNTESLRSLSKLENDQGNLYLDFSALPRFRDIFLKPEYAGQAEALGRFAQSGFFDVRIADHDILLNGIGLAGAGDQPTFLTQFAGQTAQELGIVAWLPERTSVAKVFNFSTFTGWHNQLSAGWSVADPAQWDRFTAFESTHRLPTDWIANEVATAELESAGTGPAERLLFIRAADAGAGVAALRQLQEQISTAGGDTVYYELFNEQEIVQLTYENWPQAMFGPAFAGFENCYFTEWDGYVVLGNSSRAVRYFLGEVAVENVWGKSVRMTRFLENTLGEASYSLFFNLHNNRTQLNALLHPDWQKLWQDEAAAFRPFDLLAFQVSQLDGRYYTSLALGHRDMPATTAAPVRTAEATGYTLPARAITRPYLVRNHVDNTFEVLLQDSLKSLMLLTTEGKLLWSADIGDAVRTDILQVDYFKNRKLQYLFATRNRLWLVDRNGDRVSPFPVDLPSGSDIEFLSVVDYDNNRDYRFMLADRKGNILLCGKDGKPLEGWNPLALGHPLAEAPFHLRVRGGDCMIALERRGRIHVMRRRNDSYPGFPIDLGTPVRGPLFVDHGNNFATTLLNAVTESGEIVQVNLNGVVVKRQQLVKPSADCRFWLVPDVLGKTYVILRQEYNKLSFLDRQGGLLFEQSFASSGFLDVQFYHFSAERQYFAVTDREQEFSYLYDRNGTLFNQQPLESSYPVALMYMSKQNRYQLFRNFQDRFSKLVIE